MQKLQVEFKNVPVDAPQVYRSTNLPLNKLEKVSVADKVLACNTLEVGQSQRTERSIKPYVFVISKDGTPLMPCSCAKAKRMLKKGIAHVIQRTPFTIQLSFECENVVQPVALGIDSGYSNVGFSTVSDKKELISGELLLENYMSSRLIEKKAYRNNRRSRLWYRKPRFLNRVSSKKKGWLAPSIERRLETHISLVNKIKKLLPISRVIIETTNFDIQKINNPDIKGIEYQQGNLYEYQNARSYLMSREHGLCQLCLKNFKEQPSHIHHITPKLNGGTDKPDNLAILHEKCHKRLHKQKLYGILKKNRQFKAETFMSILNKRIPVMVDCEVTYGYKTFVDRNKLGLEKSHINDAFVIAGGFKQICSAKYSVTQKKKNNRKLQVNRKGTKPLIRKHRYLIQPKDLVWVNGVKYISIGTHGYGKYLKVLNKSNKILNFVISKIEKHYISSTLMWDIF